MARAAVGLGVGADGVAVGVAVWLGAGIGVGVAFGGGGLGVEVAVIVGVGLAPTDWLGAALVDGTPVDEELGVALSVGTAMGGEMLLCGSGTG
jgi:hypothetical protein